MKRCFVLMFLLPIMCFGQRMGNAIIQVKPLPVLPPSDQRIESFLKLNRTYQGLSKDQKEWFYWTNYSRIDPRRFWDSIVVPLLEVYPQFKSEYSSSLRRDLYASPSLPLFIPNVQLQRIASAHAGALAAKRASPSHTSPNGNSFEARMQQANIKKCAGENISFGPANTVLALVLLYLDQGLPDLGHRKSLLNPRFTEMGIGISVYPDNKLMVVQDFSCNQSL